MDKNLIGRTYGPFVYEAGAEKIREFAYALHGGIPSMVYTHPPPPGTPREYVDAAYAEEKFGGRGVVAPPTFCVNFAMKPFGACTLDKDLNLNVLMLVHGEQEFEFLEPIRAGDLLTTMGTLTNLAEKAGMNFVVVTTETKNQHGRVAVRAVWTAVARR